MDTDHILATLNGHRVNYILIGGMNFLLHHQPIATFDIDFWIEDSDENRIRCHDALIALGASWGPNDEPWREVAQMPETWLTWQGVYCLNSRHGAIDLFRTVKGLGSWADSRERARTGVTASGTPYVGLSDADMLQCQLALSEEEQKLDRVRILKAALNRNID